MMEIEESREERKSKFVRYVLRLLAAVAFSFLPSLSLSLVLFTPYMVSCVADCINLETQVMKVCYDLR